MSSVKVNKRQDANTRLCHAVQNHPLIYDRSHEDYNNRDAYDLAWLNVSENCEESVPSCKSRWRQIRYNFDRSIKEAHNKSTGSRTREYYLADVLDFLLPHMRAADDVDFTTEDEKNNARRRRRTKPIKAKEKIKSEHGSDVEETEKNDENIKTIDEQEVEEINKETNCNGEAMKNEDEDETKPLKRPTSSRSNEEKNEKEEKEKHDNEEEEKNEKEEKEMNEKQEKEKNEKEEKEKKEKEEKGKNEEEGKEEIEKEANGKNEEEGKVENEEEAKENNDEEAKENNGKEERKNSEKGRKGENEQEERVTESVKSAGDKINESQTKRRSQLVKSKQVENTELNESPTKKIPQSAKSRLVDNADNTKTLKAKETETNKTQNKTPKKNICAFVISPKNDGTFFIKKKNDETKVATRRLANRETEDKAKPQENNAHDSKTEESEDMEEDIPLKQISERSLRLNRACKRNLSKTLDESPDSAKEPEVKRSRRCAERLKSVAKAKQELSKSLELPKRETRVTKLNDLEVSRKRRNIINVALHEDIIEIDPLAPPKRAVNNTNSTPKLIVPPKMATNHSPLRQRVLMDPLRIPTTNKKLMVIGSTQTTAVRLAAVGVQCDLLKTEATDDFLSTLRPYLNDMNARQKLHFKKKMFESLMEVFDSGDDFPAAKKAKLAATAAASTAIIPPQLKGAVSGEELSLVRELVAMVQAAKQTPELTAHTIDTNSNSSIESNDSLAFLDAAEIPPTPSPAKTDTTSKPPPLLRVTTTNISQHGAPVSSAQLPPCLQPRASAAQQQPTTMQSSTTTPTTTVLTPTQAIAAQQKRHVIRKLVKVNESGVDGITAANSDTIVTTSEGRRRIYRILPNNGLRNTTLRRPITSSAGASSGIHIIPTRTTTATSASATGLQVISPQTNSITSASSGCVQTSSPPSTDFTTSVSGGIQVIKPRGTDLTSVVQKGIQVIGSRSNDLTSAVQRGIQLIGPRSNEPTSGANGRVQLIKPRDIGDMSDLSKATQLLKSKGIQIFKTRSGCIQMISPRASGSAAIQTISPTTVSSSNTSTTTTTPNIQRFFTAETSSASTSSNNSSSASTTPSNPMNVQRTVTTSNLSANATTTTSAKQAFPYCGKPVKASWAPLSIASVTHASGARPLVRRYSVCGPIPSSMNAIERTTSPTDILTTTANDKSASSVPKLSMVGPNSPASLQHNNELFKLPTPLRSLNSTTATATATTTTTSAMGKPAVSASAANNSSSARTMPHLVGLSRSQQAIYSSNSNTSNELEKGLNLRSYYSTISTLTNSDDEDTRSQNSLLTAAEKRFTSDMEISTHNFEGIDFSGVIGSDNYEVVTIKNEPIDFD